MNHEKQGETIPLSEFNEGNHPCSGRQPVGDMPQGIEVMLSNALGAFNEALGVVVPKLLVFK
jgi:hypothetical protein